MKPPHIEHLLTDWPGIKLDMICKGEESVVLTIDDLDRLYGVWRGVGEPLPITHEIVLNWGKT